MLGHGRCGKPAHLPGPRQFSQPNEISIVPSNPITRPAPRYDLDSRYWPLVEETAIPMNPLCVLITAGPTHEPIDEVRYLANRSSGRLGIELAEAALDAGWVTTLALGPTPNAPRTEPHPNQGSSTGSHTQSRERRFQLIRFRTTADLQKCLEQHAQQVDILIMAAAVADYRPAPLDTGTAASKLRRSEEGLTLQLEATPDLVAACVQRRSQQQNTRPRLIVGFALEPAEGLQEAAVAKLQRKGLDLIVANPLETMDSDTIEASVLSLRGTIATTKGPIDKREFGHWLVNLLVTQLSNSTHLG